MSLKPLYEKGKKHFIFPHILFWSLSIILFTVVLFYTRGDFNFYNIDIEIAGNILLTIGFLAVSVYINLLWLIPFYFDRRKYLLFFILEIGNINFFIFTNYFVSVLLEGGLHPNFITEYIAEFILVVIFLVISTMLKFTRDSITLQGFELKIKEVERQKIEAELRALKAQVNPHFFFNTLNSLYSLSLDKSDKAPELILKLSDLMRYVIYETKDDLVPIGKQLDFLKNYVYLEKLRSNEWLEVKFDVIGENYQLKVAPLLFIPFIENAFKHGVKTRDLNPYIHISFNLEQEDRIVFIIENNTEEVMENTCSSGFGLPNVKKRLELLYPGKCLLNIQNPRNSYRVELTIYI